MKKLSNTKKKTDYGEKIEYESYTFNDNPKSRLAWWVRPVNLAGNNLYTYSSHCCCYLPNLDSVNQENEVGEFL